MEVTIDTNCEDFIDMTGKFPVGHIRGLMNHYIDRAENLDYLLKVYQDRLKELEASDNPHKSFLIRELKNVFIKGRCDWEAESIWDRPMDDRCDMQLRHYPDERLG